MWRVACRAVLGLLAVLPALAADTDARKPPASAQDLQYGETLFHYYQNDWFNSIIRLQIAQEQERLPYHRDEAELLLGGLDLSYGLRNEAGRIFEQLLADSDTDAQTRNRAWFYLAKISYQRGDMADALEALSRVSGDMTPATRVEAYQLHSLMLLELGQNEAAITVADEARQAGSWSPYLAYNLGVACIRSGQLERGALLLDSLGEMSGDSEELRLLRDKANLALGYSYLQKGATKASHQALQRVRLEGPLSNKALLGAGWADAEADDYGRALIAWSELGRRDVTDPAVQEVILAMPYAMTRMNLHGRAVQHYNDAIETLHEEKDKLDDSIAAIERGDLLEILRTQDLRSGSGWLQELTLDTQSPALRYQVTLMADHTFQEAVKNYRDLMVLHNNLSTWAGNIDAYEDMVTARKQRFGSHQPRAEQALQSSARAHLEQRHRDLGQRLARIETTADASGLAITEERRQIGILHQIREKLDVLPVNPETRAMRERLSRIEGALLWKLSTAYKPRLWTAKREMQEISNLLDQSLQAQQALDSASIETPAEFQAFRQRIAGHRNRIRTLLDRTGSLDIAQGRLIEQLAVAELERQKKRIDTYIVQARFSLAQTFDSALHTARDDMR